MKEALPVLPNSVPELKAFSVKLLKENAALQDEIRKNEQKAQLVMHEIENLQNIAQSPEFEESLVAQENEKLQTQIKIMAETEKAANEEIICLQKQLKEQKQEFEQISLQNYEKELQELNSVTELNATLESDKLAYLEFHDEIVRELQVRQDLDIEQEELEIIEDFELIKESLEKKEEEIYQLETEINESYDEKEELLENLADLQNDTEKEEKFNLFEQEVEELQSILEYEQNENKELTAEKEKANKALEATQEQLQEVREQLEDKSHQLLLFRDMNNELEELESDLSEAKAKNTALTTENQELRLDLREQEIKINFLSTSYKEIEEREKDYEDNILSLNVAVEGLHEEVMQEQGEQYREVDLHQFYENNVMNEAEVARIPGFDHPNENVEEASSQLANEQPNSEEESGKFVETREVEGEEVDSESITSQAEKVGKSNSEQNSNVYTYAKDSQQLDERQLRENANNSIEESQQAAQHFESPIKRLPETFVKTLKTEDLVEPFNESNTNLDQIVSNLLQSSEKDDSLKNSKLNEFSEKEISEELSVESFHEKCKTQVEKTQYGIVEMLSRDHKDLYNRIMQKRLEQNVK